MRVTEILSSRRFRLSAILLVVAVSAFAGILFRYIDQLYYSVGYTAIVRKLAVEQPADSPQAIVDRSFDYVHRWVRLEMLPNYGGPSFKTLEYGYGFCDQQADILMNLLYHQGVVSRVVPLYWPDGVSRHTYMEWWNGKEWLILDPIFGYNLPVSGRQFATLPAEELTEKLGLTQDAYEFYETTYGEALRHTYAQKEYRYWGPLQEKKLAVSRNLDQIVARLFDFSDHTLPRLVQAAYIWKHYRDGSPESQYLIARNRLILGDHQAAALGYAKIMEHELPEEWPPYATFSVNKPMLQQRLQLIEENLGVPVSTN
jgi:hypothetical protein